MVLLVKSKSNFFFVKKVFFTSNKNATQKIRQTFRLCKEKEGQKEEGQEEEEEGNQAARIQVYSRERGVRSPRRLNLE